MTRTPPPVSPYTGEQQTLEASRIVILPIPYEQTTTYLKGCRRGPAALMAASGQMETYDDELDGDVSTLGIHTALPG